jgi:hypothetical protein
MSPEVPLPQSPMKQTVIYRFVCRCGTVNSGTLSVIATCMSSAVAQAMRTPFACTQCGEAAPGKSVALEAQLLSF